MPAIKSGFEPCPGRLWENAVWPQASLGLRMAAMRGVSGGRAWMLYEEMWRVGLELEVRGQSEMAQDCCGPCKDSQREKTIHWQKGLQKGLGNEEEE